MDYKLIIVKEAGDLSAELQTADQGHRQAFNIYDVIGDYKKIKRVAVSYTHLTLPTICSV